MGAAPARSLQREDRQARHARRLRTDGPRNGRWLTQLQHSGKSVVVVGILEETKDDFGRIEFVPQIEGSKTGRELPGIFDQVITGGMFIFENGARAGLRQGNAARLHLPPAERLRRPGQGSQRRLDAIEAPDLGALLKKIQTGPRVDTPTYAAPVAPS
jgi:hypothetical protein